VPAPHEAEASGDVARFLERFRRFGAAPGVETYLALFHPEATLFDSGMPRPLTVPEIPEHIAGILKLVPDFRMEPERWRSHAPTIFVEAHNQATLAGARVEWPSVYCIDLRGDQVIRGRRYYDRRPLFARLSPEIAKVPAIACEAPRVGRSVPPEPIGLASLRGLVPDLKAKLLCEAGDDTLVMREWELRGTRAGQPLRCGLVDRFDLDAGRVAAGAAYFDTLALPAA
jgi:hypothetical protein